MPAAICSPRVTDAMRTPTSGCRPAARPSQRAANTVRTRHRCPPIRGTPVGFSWQIVEVAGIEPASSSFSVGLLRAQPVSGCRGRLRYRRQRRTVSGEDVPGGQPAKPLRWALLDGARFRPGGL